jgi:hypothetical protein
VRECGKKIFEVSDFQIFSKYLKNYFYMSKLMVETLSIWVQKKYLNDSKIFQFF